MIKQIADIRLPCGHDYPKTCLVEFTDEVTLWVLLSRPYTLMQLINVDTESSGQCPGCMFRFIWSAKEIE